MARVRHRAGWLIAAAAAAVALGQLAPAWSGIPEGTPLFSYQGPTTRADGSPYPEAERGGYRLICNGSLFATIDDWAQETYQALPGDFAPGSYDCGFAAFDTAGRESDLSQTVGFSISAGPGAPLAAPASFSVQMSQAPQPPSGGTMPGQSYDNIELTGHGGQSAGGGDTPSLIHLADDLGPLPANAAAVLLRLNVESSSARWVGCKNPDETNWHMLQDLGSRKHVYVWCGINSNGDIHTYGESSFTAAYVLAVLTSDEIVLFSADGSDDVLPAIGSGSFGYHNPTLVPDDASAAFHNGTGNYATGVGDANTGSGVVGWAGNIQIFPVNSSGEVYYRSYTDVAIHGYFKAGIFVTDWEDPITDQTADDTWQDVTQTNTNAILSIYRIDLASVGDTVYARKNGGTFTPPYSGSSVTTSMMHQAAPLDANGAFELWSENYAGTSYWVDGWIVPASGGGPVDVALGPVSAIGSLPTSAEKIGETAPGAVDAAATLQAVPEKIGETAPGAVDAAATIGATVRKELDQDAGAVSAAAAFSTSTDKIAGPSLTPLSAVAAFSVTVAKEGEDVTNVALGPLSAAGTLAVGIRPEVDVTAQLAAAAALSVSYGPEDAQNLTPMAAAATLQATAKKTADVDAGALSAVASFGVTVVQESADVRNVALGPLSAAASWAASGQEIAERDVTLAAAAALSVQAQKVASVAVSIEAAAGLDASIGGIKTAAPILSAAGSFGASLWTLKQTAAYLSAVADFSVSHFAGFAADFAGTAELMGVFDYEVTLTAVYDVDVALIGKAGNV